MIRLNDKYINPRYIEAVLDPEYSVVSNHPVGYTLIARIFIKMSSGATYSLSHRFEVKQDANGQLVPTRDEAQDELERIVKKSMSKILEQ